MPARDFAPPGTRRLCVMRDGHAVVRAWRIPKPTVLIDTREQQPYDLVGAHPNWIGAVRTATLKTGDYTIEGMESLLALERKSMVDAIQCTIIVTPCVVNGRISCSGQPTLTIQR